MCAVCTCSEDDAFRNSVESITGPISRIISREGMPGVYAALDASGKKEFERVRCIPISKDFCFFFFLSLCSNLSPCSAVPAHDSSAAEVPPGLACRTPDRVPWLPMLCARRTLMPLYSMQLMPSMRRRRWLLPGRYQ